MNMKNEIPARKTRRAASYVPPINWLETDIYTPIPRYRCPEEKLSLLSELSKQNQFDFIEGRVTSLKVGELAYYAGDLSLLQKPCVAVVGTRKISDAGKKRTERLTRELVSLGFVIVSGLALGVDTVALETAVREGGKVIAVIGTPLDKASPASNKRLQEHIYKEHLLMSPFAHGTRVYKSNFPTRNRVMATISDATVIVEASETSGTVHQAAECKRLNRHLFILKSLADNQKVKWPKSFLNTYEKAEALVDTQQIAEALKDHEAVN